MEIVSSSVLIELRTPYSYINYIPVLYIIVRSLNIRIVILRKHCLLMLVFTIMFRDLKILLHHDLRFKIVVLLTIRRKCSP